MPVAPTTAGTKTAAVTATDQTGATGSVTFTAPALVVSVTPPGVQ